MDYFEPAVIRNLTREKFDALDREIVEWYEGIPEEIKIKHFGKELPQPSTSLYNAQRLQIWTRLRFNQIRIWLHTPVLHSASSIQDNMQLAQKAVDLSKDTITFLAHLNNTTNLYRRMQVFYHQFLTSAIAVLFLASTHAPLVFSSQCHNEFYLALDLVKDMSAKSWVSQRLWRTCRSLKAYAPRLGLEDTAASNQPGALFSFNGFNNALSGNGSYPRPESLPATPMAAMGSANDPNNGIKLSTEMGRIFEGYISMTGLPTATTSMSPDEAGLTKSIPTTDGSGKEGIYATMRDMF